MRTQFAVLGGIVAAFMVTAVAVAAYNASGTWQGNACEQVPEAECYPTTIVFTQDSAGNLSGIMGPDYSVTATYLRTDDGRRYYRMSIISASYCVALSGKVQIRTRTNTLTGNLAGTENCADNHFVSGSVSLTRISP